MGTGFFFARSGDGAGFFREIREMPEHPYKTAVKYTKRFDTQAVFAAGFP